MLITQYRDPCRDRHSTVTATGTFTVTPTVAPTVTAYANYAAQGSEQASLHSDPRSDHYTVTPLPDIDPHSDLIC